MDQKDKQTSTESSSSFESPGWLDFRPEPEKPMRVGRKPAVIAWVLAISLLGLFAYGGWKRQQRQIAAVSDNSPKHVAPATSAGNQIARTVPAGNAPIARMSAAGMGEPDSDGELQPDPAQSAPNQPNSAGKQERTAVSQPPAPPAVQMPPATVEPSPEEKRIAIAYEQEQEAMAAPTAIRPSFASAPTTGQAAPVSASTSLTGTPPGLVGNAPAASVATASRDTDYDDQNMQTRKASFVANAQNATVDDYLRSTRALPVSRYEIKAGWEIPAVLEQALNSDLPGETKALVTANVYDTATGRYLLIPQGARLIGDYDSHVSYGQDGLQAVWRRIVYPDASSIDLNGMEGLDAQGNAGLRDTVDRHYKRLIGFTALSSLFDAGFGLSQNQRASVLTYPGPTEVAGSAVGQEVSQTGAQLTRRNLNVQPTIKVPAGYKFIVRVNRDIVFDGPYEPNAPEVPQTDDLRRR